MKREDWQKGNESTTPPMERILSMELWLNDIHSQIIEVPLTIEQENQNLGFIDID